MGFPDSQRVCARSQTCRVGCVVRPPRSFESPRGSLCWPGWPAHRI